MKRTVFILLTLLISTIYADHPKIIETQKNKERQISHNNLQSFFEAAKEGDYIVTKTGQLITLIRIRSITPKFLALEEISTPAKNIKEGHSWAKWVKNKAPGHSSWQVVEIDLKSSEIVESYSFSKNGHLQVSQKESMIATLLQLPLQEVKLENRRRIGPPPLDGEPDFRKIWHPPFIFEGKAVSHPEFSVLETIWPSDETELSRSKVTLYFDREQKIPFPCWVDLETSHVLGHFQVIDSGKNLASPERMIPRRPPQFIKAPQETASGLLLTLKSSKTFQEFTLYAIDLAKDEKTIFSIPCTIRERNGEIVTIQVEKEDLAALESNHRYQWMVSPLGFDECLSEASKSFMLTGSEK